MVNGRDVFDFFSLSVEILLATMYVLFRIDFQNFNTYSCTPLLYMEGHMSSLLEMLIIFLHGNFLSKIEWLKLMGIL